MSGEGAEHASRTGGRETGPGRTPGRDTTSKRGPAAAPPSAERTQVASAPPSAEKTQVGGVPPSWEATRGAGDAGVRAGRLARGAVVGRYVVLRELGAGGMGVVYAAYDPELDRKVALKLLRAAGGGTTIEAGTAARTSAHGRLLREAKALAQLSHPNVVAVHDVGEHDGRVYLAMEFVEGQTLRAWAKAKRHGWQAVLHVYLAAGRGLAAAHARGLVHRDVKPENLVLGKDGRVRVLDFGLVRLRNPGGNRPTQEDRGAGTGTGHGSTTGAGAGHGSTTGPGTGTGTHTAAGTGSEAGTQTGPGTGAGMEVALTVAGAVVGTPAYMAPEQLSGGEVGPAADQFAFCVSLWEGLYGERPFAGNTPAQVAFHVLEGRVRQPPAGRKVPRWLRRALERGLSVDPARRFSSMEALLETLEKGKTRARLRKAAAGVAALSVAIAAGAGWRRFEHAQKVAACEATAGEVASAWNDEAAAAITTGLVGTGVSYAADTADRVVGHLAGQARAWRDARVEACLASEVEGRWTPDLYARSRWCLEDRRLELSALVRELSAPPPDTARTVVQKAVQAAVGLPRVGPCVDAQRLAHLPDAPPPQRASTLANVRRKLSQAEARAQAGRYEAALALAREALAEAEELHWPPFSARARVVVGELLEKNGRYDEAEAVLAEAYFSSAKDGLWETAAQAATGLCYTVGYRKAQHALGLSWGKHAEVALARLGEPPDGLRRAHLWQRLAGIRVAQGAFDEALALFERARSTWNEALGTEHPLAVHALNNLAGIHMARGEYDEARSFYERALALQENQLGGAHPDVAASLADLAIANKNLGRYDVALALSQRALGIWEKSLGPEHPDVARALLDLGGVHWARGAFDEAQVLYERALAIWEKTLGPKHPDVARALNSLGVIHAERGEYDDAQTYFTRALAIQETVMGPENPSVTQPIDNLATVHWIRGSYDEALALFLRSLAIREKVLGPEHPNVAYSLCNLADVHRDRSAHADARALYERALALWENTLGPEHPTVARPLLGLAKIDLERGRAARAVPLARRALAIRQKAQVRAEELGEARFVLARALWTAPPGQGRDRAQARALARKALADYEAAGEPRAKEREAVRAFLTRHAAPSG